MDFETLYDVRDGLLCFVSLIGMIGGFILLIRRKIIPGLLAMLGFFLISLFPTISIVLYDIIYPNASNIDYEMWDWIYLCIHAGGLALGILMLALAFFLLAFDRQKSKLAAQAPLPPTDIYTPL